MASKPKKPRTLAPGIYPVIDHVTPDIRDLLIYIEVDSRLAGYKLPDYGSKYGGPRGHLLDDPWVAPELEPDKVGRYDEHELVHVTPADERGMVRWYYARRREQQAKYNFEWDTPGTTSEGYESYTRTYVVHRDDVVRYRRSYIDEQQNTHYDGDLCLREGDPDPDFLYQEQHKGYKFTKQVITRVNDEVLDGLFVIIKLTFHDLIPKTRVAKDPEFGEIKTTIVYDYTPFNYDTPTSSKSDMPEYNLGDTYILPDDELTQIELDEAGYDEQPDWKILSVDYVEYNADKTLRRTELSTAVIPTEKRSTITADDDYCQIKTYVWHENDIANIPEVGVEKTEWDPDTQEDVGTGEFTKTVNINPGVSPEIFKVTEVTVQLPTEIKTTITEDDLYCGLYTSVFYDHKDNVELPSLGEQFNETGQVIDITQQDTDCFGIVRYTIVSGQIPTPKKISERTDKEQCRIVTEEFVDSEDFLLPEIDSEHYSDTTLKVVDTNEVPLGCRGVKNITITYAVVPSPPRQTEREDDEWGRVVEHTFYDLLDQQPVTEGEEPVTEGEAPVTETEGLLPSHGDTYEGGIVIQAEAQDVNCGQLRRYVIGTVQLPTEKKYLHREDDTYCGLETEVFYADTEYILPLLGATYGAGVVIDIESTAVNTGGVTKYSITSGLVPSPVKRSERSDNEQCRIVTEEFVEKNTYQLPALDTKHTTDTSLTVVDVQETPLGCRGVKNVKVVYAEIPTPPKTSEYGDDEFGTVQLDVFYDTDLLGTYQLPKLGDLYQGGYIIGAKKEEVNCGTLIKVELRYAFMPTLIKRTKSQDLEFCDTLEESYYAIESIEELPQSGEARGARWVYEAVKKDIDLGQVVQLMIKSITLPTPTKTTKRKDDDMCIILTEEFYDTEKQYTPPAIHTVHPDELGEELPLKLIDKSEVPLGCGGIFKHTLVYAEVPTPPRTTEYDHPEYCRVQVDTFYDVDGSYALPAQGETYQDATVIEAKAIDVDCTGLRKYEIHYVTLPFIKEELIKDSTYCEITRFSKYITTFYVDGEPLPTQGDLYNSKYVVESQEQVMGCEQLVKQQIDTTTLPTKTLEGTQYDDIYCEVDTESLIQLTSTFVKNVGTKVNGKFILEATAKPIGCGKLQSVNYVLATVPTPILTVQNTDNEYCTITETTQVVEDGDEQDLSIGDTASGGGIVIDYQLKPEKCGKLIREIIKTVASLPTDKRTSKAQGSDICGLKTDIWYDREAEIPVEGDAYEGAYVIKSQAKGICGDLARVEVEYATLPTQVKSTEGVHELFCNVTKESWYDLTDSIDDFQRGDNYGTGGQVVIEFEKKPYGCGVISEVMILTGTVPSEALEGNRINQVTGLLEPFNKFVIKSADIESYAQDVQETGDFATIEPYGCGLSLVNEANIRPFEEQEYRTNINYSFPPVLQQLSLYVWALRKGGTEIHPQYLWKRAAYSGPCEARIVESWHKTDPGPTAITTRMVPTPISYSCPLFRAGTSACLHGTITFRCDFGTSHKKYKLSAGSTWIIQATTETDWPSAEFLTASTVKPGYGGFIKTDVYVTPPAV